MLARTHMTSAIALGTLPLTFDIMILSPEMTKFYLMGLLLGSLLPDIDETNSAIGRRFLFLSLIISKFVVHRGITHKFVFFLLFFVLTSFTISNGNDHLINFMVGLTFGILFHHMGDMLSGDPKNKGGINDYFYPILLSNRRVQIFPRFMRCELGKIKEYMYLFIFLMIMMYNFSSIIFNAV